MDLIEDVKGELRITNNDPQILREIEGLIEACRIDLMLSGVSQDKANSDEDPLIKRAIIFYAKAYFGIDNPQADRFLHSYKMLKNHLSLASDYNGNAME